MRRLLASVVLTAVVVTGCGGGGSEAERVLDDAEEHLASVRSGSLLLSLSGTAEADGRRTKPVGFRVEGPFQLGDAGFPKLDVAYTRLLGAESDTVHVRSDGTSGWLVDGAVVTPLPAAQLTALRQSRGSRAAVPELGLADWFDEPEVAGDVVTGEVDVVELLGDLQRLAAEVDGREAAASLDDAAAGRLRKAVRSSHIEVRTTGGRHALRSLRATIDFGSSSPDAVDEALQRYAAPRLDLRLTYAPLERPLEVARPGAAARS